MVITIHTSVVKCAVKVSVLLTPHRVLNYIIFIYRYNADNMYGPVIICTRSFYSISLYYPEKSPHPLINDHRNSYDWAELIVYLNRYTHTRVGLAIIFTMGINNKNDKKEYYDIVCAVLRLDRVSGRERGR